MRVRYGVVGDPEKTETIIADALLVAAGRVPNVEKLNLEAAGVKYNRRGIVVNKYLQSSQPHIWAAGDIAGSYQFTHVADYHGMFHTAIAKSFAATKAWAPDNLRPADIEFRFSSMAEAELRGLLSEVVRFDPDTLEVMDGTLPTVRAEIEILRHKIECIVCFALLDPIAGLDHPAPACFWRAARAWRAARRSPFSAAAMPLVSQ